MTKFFSRALLSTIITLVLATGIATASTTPVDRIVVKKSERLLLLFSGQQVLRSYPVSLGGSPIGHKLYRGDKRTPEGRYQIDWRNPQSRYHLALHISYPSADDRKRAARLGLNPGGNIMLHGLPKRYADGASVLLDLDWTDGCIAVSNQAIEEIWQLVADNTVIDIYP